ncbi:hypothetical protein BROC_00610 [Candidatus Brocadiaceae bacterium]|nr:hypothetical protein BROC_00610 [Candidatus Brocadiaceae bacterium]
MERSIIKKVFVSSTNFDLVDYRAEIRDLLNELGYEPLMNEYPINFTLEGGLDSYDECIHKVKEADIFILIIGKRYHGNVLDKGISITELEYDTACNYNIRRINFCLKEVWYSNRFYKINKNLEFPKDYDDGYKLMKFLDKVRKIETGKTDNWVNQFENISEIKKVLKKQFKDIEIKEMTKQSANQDIFDGIIVPKINFSHFPDPFVKDDRLNALIIVGDSYPHGKYNKCAHACDALMVSHILNIFQIKETSLHFAKFDTWVTERELKENNLILLGGPTVNTYIDYLYKTNKLFIYLDIEKDLLKSRITKKSYDSRFYGSIQIISNPFNEDKYILVCLGHSGPGTIAAVLALREKYRHEIIKNNIINENIPAKVVCGRDLDNDQWVDDLEFWE